MAEAGSLLSPDTSQCSEASREGQRRRAGRGRGLITGWQLHSALSFLISSVALQPEISQGREEEAAGFPGDNKQGGQGFSEVPLQIPQTLPESRDPGREAPSIRYRQRLEKQQAWPWLGCGHLQVLPSCSTGPREHGDFQSPAGVLLNCCWELPTGSKSLQTQDDHVAVGWAPASCQALADHSQCMNPNNLSKPFEGGPEPTAQTGKLGHQLD